MRVERMHYEILTADEFDAWLIELRWKNGTRIYSFHWGQTVVVELYVGNKNGQDRDIKKAKKIRDEVLEGLCSVRK